MTLFPVGRIAAACSAVTALPAALTLALIAAPVPALAQSATANAPDAAAGPASGDNKQDFSAAERVLLMSKQFSLVKPPMTLSYRFRKSGSLEEAFEDKVTVKLKAVPKDSKDAKAGSCCQVDGEFLTGARKVNLPPIEQAEGNPVTLYFLEHDIREMQRLTKGSTSYFRKRIRMALYDSATVNDLSVTYKGKPSAGKEIVIRPYLADPNRNRFEQHASKQYVFVLSDAVPGAVVSIRCTTFDAGGKPLIDEEMLLEGAESPRVAALP